VRVARSRPSQTPFGRQLVGWIAAYALVLHAAFAGIVATQLAVATAGTTAPGFEICLSGHDGAPISGHGQGQHENCAIHCATVAGAVPVLALALLALVFAPRGTSRPVRLVFSGSFEFLRRAWQSRAPPLPA